MNECTLLCNGLLAFPWPKALEKKNQSRRKVFQRKKIHKSCNGKDIIFIPFTWGLQYSSTLNERRVAKKKTKPRKKRKNVKGKG